MYVDIGEKAAPQTSGNTGGNTRLCQAEGETKSATSSSPLVLRVSSAMDNITSARIRCKQNEACTPPSTPASKPHNGNSAENGLTTPADVCASRRAPSRRQTQTQNARPRERRRTKKVRAFRERPPCHRDPGTSPVQVTPSREATDPYSAKPASGRAMGRPTKPGALRRRRQAIADLLGFTPEAARAASRTTGAGGACPRASIAAVVPGRNRERRAGSCKRCRRPEFLEAHMELAE